MPATPGAPGGLKLSNEGNWKGSETGTRPPNIPKPSGRPEGLPRREVPAVDTCRNKTTSNDYCYSELYEAKAKAGYMKVTFNTSRTFLKYS